LHTRRAAFAPVAPDGAVFKLIRNREGVANGMRFDQCPTLLVVDGDGVCRVWLSLKGKDAVEDRWVLAGERGG